MSQAVEPEALTSVAKLAKRSDVLFALGMMLILSILILPVPTWLLTMLLTANLSLAVLVLLVAIYTKEPLEFNTFPSLLLVTTLFRLGLNVASTRLILMEADGGALIATFGEFVVGGQIVIGLVVFSILLIIQLVVITKGSGRVAEVAARFTLDAMPGKQMAIDADLNAGLISEKDARERRQKISSEAEFYGAMDGASKFVKGDAIAGLIITLVNLVAGMLIGMTYMGLDFATAVETFSILTVGDGLVSQIPSLLIAIAAGMLITKSQSENSIGQDLPKQFMIKGRAILIASGVIMVMGLVPGMPTMPFAIIAVTLFILYRLVRNYDSESAELAEKEAKAEEESDIPEEKVEDLIAGDRIVVEVGYRLISLVDKSRGGQLLERITSLRKQLAREDGLLIPPIRIKDNIQIDPNAYRICIYGDEIANGSLQADRLLAIDGGSVHSPVQGIATKEPAFGLDAVWIDEARRGEAEALGYAVTDPASVFITHITQLLRGEAARILNREDVQQMLESLKRESPTLVKDVEENVKLGLVQKVFGTLLEERIPLSNLEKILECISDHPNTDPATIAEQVRSKIGPTIVKPHLDQDNNLHAIIFDPQTEQYLSRHLAQAQHGGGLSLAPHEASQLIDDISTAAKEIVASGRDAVLLSTAPLRRPLRQVLVRFIPDLPVLSYSEIDARVSVQISGTVSMTAEQEAVS